MTTYIPGPNMPPGARLTPSQICYPDGNVTTLTGQVRGPLRQALLDAGIIASPPPAVAVEFKPGDEVRVLSAAIPGKVNYERATVVSIDGDWAWLSLPTHHVTVRISRLEPLPSPSPSPLQPGDIVTAVLPSSTWYRATVMAVVGDEVWVQNSAGYNVVVTEDKVTRP